MSLQSAAASTFAPARVVLKTLVGDRPVDLDRHGRDAAGTHPGLTSDLSTARVAERTGTFPTSTPPAGGAPTAEESAAVDALFQQAASINRVAGRVLLALALLVLVVLALVVFR